jgi:hypothetical protein
MNPYDDLKIAKDDPGPTYMIRACCIVFALTLAVWYCVERYSEPTLMCESNEVKRLVSEITYPDGSIEWRYVREYKMTPKEKK